MACISGTFSPFSSRDRQGTEEPNEKSTAPKHDALHNTERARMNGGAGEQGDDGMTAGNSELWYKRRGSSWLRGPSHQVQVLEGVRLPSSKPLDRMARRRLQEVVPGRDAEPLRRAATPSRDAAASTTARYRSLAHVLHLSGCCAPSEIVRGMCRKWAALVMSAGMRTIFSMCWQSSAAKYSS